MRAPTNTIHDAPGKEHYKLHNQWATGIEANSDTWTQSKLTKKWK